MYSRLDVNSDYFCTGAVELVLSATNDTVLPSPKALSTLDMPIATTSLNYRTLSTLAIGSPLSSMDVTDSSVV